MGLNPNTRWPSTTRSRRRASGPETQYQWPSEERILSQAITAPVFDFAEVFGPSTEFADWGLGSLTRFTGRFLCVDHAAISAVV